MNEQILQILENPDLTFPQRMEYIERVLMMDALDRNNWVKLKAARDLKITYRIFNYKCDKYKLFLTSPRRRRKSKAEAVTA